MFDHHTLIIVGIAVASVTLLVIAVYIGYHLGRDYTDVEIATLRAEHAQQLADAWQAIHGNADLCNEDSDHLADLYKHVAAMETHPASPPHPAEPQVRPTLALPAAPAVREAVDATWNGGTATFDKLAALKKFSRITEVPPLWHPPAERASVPLYGDDDTTEITVLTVTGELVPE